MAGVGSDVHTARSGRSICSPSTITARSVPPATAEQRSAGLEPGSTRPPLVPLFVAGFIAMVTVRSLGVVPPVLVDLAKPVQGWLLGAAMFALGTSVHWTVLRRTGARPVVLAAGATLVVLLLGGLVAFVGR